MRHKITVCMGSSCFARGNEKNIRLIQDFLRDHDLCSVVDLVGARCSGECGGGPNISIDDVRYEHLDRDRLLSLLRSKLLD
ncbi:MAG: (2Fe-2S) ferredoxin domain-containing protein [Oligosphaeraceae bacterium]|nr:(2Fe-2S) ferredoxin domain-containing protein [Oligosphaeraceae bacterium]